MFLKIETSSENLKFCRWDFNRLNKERNHDDLKYLSWVQVSENLVNFTKFLRNLCF